eukprot:3437212-Amphidinium_carterae.2
MQSVFLAWQGKDVELVVDAEEEAMLGCVSLFHACSLLAHHGPLERDARHNIYDPFRRGGARRQGHLI